MLRQVRAQPREGRLVELVPLVGELMQDARLGLHVVEDQAVRDQMVELDQLALPVAVVLGDQALAAEEEPLDEPVERLALVGSRVRVTTRKANSAAQQMCRIREDDGPFCRESLPYPKGGKQLS